MTSTPSGQTTWPYVSLALPPGTDDEAAACLTQAAVEAGALGGAIEGGRLDLYLDPSLPTEAAAALRGAVEAEAARLGWPPLDWCVQSLPDAAWATAWKADFVSLPVGERLLIRPDWEIGTPPPEPAWADRLTIWLRPGLGFGTGRHETTRLALETLERHLRPGMTVLDFGSGSGVLSIAAARLGAARVCAIDNDPQAHENARDNLALNATGDAVTLLTADRPDAAPAPADLLVCNMLPQHALRHAPRWPALLRHSESTLIYSGFLADQDNEVNGVLTGAGLTRTEGGQQGEWAVWVGRRTV